MDYEDEAKHGAEAKHRFSRAPLFERRGDRIVLRDAYDRPYERIFRLRVWLYGSLALNAALAIALYWKP